MTKADLIKALADMPDDADVFFDTRRNGLKVKSIDTNKHKNFISFNMDYDDDDDDISLDSDD